MLDLARTLSIAAIAASILPAQQSAPPAGFTRLFNGKNLDGWWGMKTEDPRALHAMDTAARAAKVDASLANIQKHWSVDDGVLVNDGHGLFLTTKRDYADFELLVDYKTVAKADSGIYLRGIPQVQIWDYTEAGGKWNIGADKGSGGLWNNSKGARGKDPLVLADKPFGEWNSFRIKLIGDRVTVHLNGKRVVNDARLENYFDRKLPIPRTGPIQLQTHGGEIRWRNVFIREIPAEEANEALRKRNGRRFQSVFNGRDLTGWRGAVDNYVVEDGVLRCKPGHGGTVYTEAEFDDFVADLEIRFPPGGNNGLAIRYPGKGDGAYTGMCELQVLENTHSKFAKLDARQYHASAYGMVAALRGYQRPVGEWNHQRVHVRGSKIRVDLNGFRILDADLATITEFMGGKPHPGKDLRSGHFGFCGHSDPVEFRNVRIRRLPRDSLEQIRDMPGLPRVLLIGDSISMGYTWPTRRRLEGIANVHRIPENGASTMLGMKKLDEWLGDGKWDVIHFNWGLHDLKFTNGRNARLVDPAKGKRYVKIEDYEQNLDKLVARLGETGAHLIWRNTTPIPKGSKGRITGDAVKYNAAAARVMQKHGVEIQDLYSLAFHRMNELMQKANVHFKLEGSEALADEVAKSIRAKLEQRR